MKRLIRKPCIDLPRGLLSVFTLGLWLLLLCTEMVAAADGKSLVETACAACHKAGVLNAPKLGDKEAWKTRIEKGEKVLIEHALKGFNAMPAKGGNPNLSDARVIEAVRYMLAQAGQKALVAENRGQQAEKPKSAKVSTAVKRGSDSIPSGKGAKAAKPVRQKAKASANATQKKRPPPVKRAAAIVQPVNKKANRSTKGRASNRRVNSFNRLMKPPSKRNPPPTRDGIHDPVSEGTRVLQHPKEAFKSMAKSKSGNRVDWVKSLADGSIEPRYDRLDPNRQPVVLDLNIIREVKGSMPNVLYPHKQHTEWLDCSNCHPSIFLPKKGANNISMASIMLGESCGVCHGKVAFPVAECRKCHSQRKAK